MAIRTEIKIEEKSLRRLQRKMQQVTDDLGDAYLPNRWIGQRLHRWVDENFQSEGGKVGGWKRFKYGGRLVTKKQSKNYRGINAQSFKGFGLARIRGRLVDTSALLLQDTGNLRGRFLDKATKTSVIIGNDVTYSEYHEYGLPMRGLPARRMLPKASDKEVSDFILAIYDDYIYQVTGK